jgi:hypothetical protein
MVNVVVTAIISPKASLGKFGDGMCQDIPQPLVLKPRAQALADYAV